MICHNLGHSNVDPCLGYGMAEIYRNCKTLSKKYYAFFHFVTNDSIGDSITRYLDKMKGEEVQKDVLFLSTLRVKSVHH